MTTPITIKKKEVLAALSERRIKEDLKKKDFYKLFFDKIKDMEICEGDQVVFKYIMKLTYVVGTNQVIAEEELTREK
jgi:hypothetical protein